MCYDDQPLREHLDSYYGPAGGIEHRFLAGASFILRECQDCGLVFQEEIPNESLMVTLYEEWLAGETSLNQFRSAQRLERSQRFVKEIVNAINYLNGDPADLKFLDFGTGWGNWSKLAQGLNCDVYGVELSQTKAEHARTLGIKMIDWDDIQNYKFDFINTEQVFEHLADPLKTLCRLKRGLKPTGIIKISVPNGEYIKLAMNTWDWAVERFLLPVVESRSSLLPVAPLQHINCFSHDSLVKMARGAGLDPISIPAPIDFCQKRNVSLKTRVKDLIRPYYRFLIRRKPQSEVTKGLCLYFGVT